MVDFYSPDDGTDNPDVLGITFTNDEDYIKHVEKYEKVE